MTDTHQDDEAALLAEAEAAAIEAKELESAILNGDTNVELEDIEAAEKRSRFARMRAQGVKARRDRAAERERLAEIARYDRLITEQFGAHDGDLVAAFDEVCKAIDVLVGKAVEYNAGFYEITQGLDRLGDLPAHLRLSPGGGHLRINDLDLDVGPVSAEQLVADAAVRVLLSHGEPSGKIQKASPATGRLFDAHMLKVFGLERGVMYGPADGLRRIAAIVAGRS